MSKHCKSSTNNQWAHNPTSNLESCTSCHSCSCGKDKKTATDNQWTSTSKIK